MKKLLFAAALLAALPWGAAAQVEKQVEVTKAYVPSVESAAKLAIAPDMTDTVKLRPDIDYTVTPLSLRTTLATRPIRPVTVTYWEFNRPLPFYLKVGAGYPLNSVLDFYASSQNPSTGYVVGYVNHEGRYADIRNEFGQKHNSTRMTNRLGAAAGKYLGRHTLEGELSYENRLYHRYGLGKVAPTKGTLDIPDSPIDYGDLALRVRVGDDFQDLSRTNFEVEAHGNLFHGHSGMDFGDEDMNHRYRYDISDEARREDGRTMREWSFGASGRIARGWGRSSFSASAGWDRTMGRKALDGDWEELLHVGLRYGLRGGVVRLEVGADYYHDRIECNPWMLWESIEEPDPVPDVNATKDNYVLPFAHLNFDLGTDALQPFVEVDGDIRPNNFGSISRLNPYTDSWLNASGNSFLRPERSSVDYNGRAGIGGTLGHGKFDYRAYVGFSIRDHHLYWIDCGAKYRAARTEDGIYLEYLFGMPGLIQDRQTVLSFGGEVAYRPVSELTLSLGIHGYSYNDAKQNISDHAQERLESGEPNFTCDFGVHYRGRKVSFGVEARMQSERKWTTLYGYIFEAETPEPFVAPFAVDLRAVFDWRISSRVAIFAEGRNLLDRRLYEYPWYPEYGANCTVGVKLNF